MSFDFVSFSYEKSPTDITNRAGFIVGKPSDNYSILEVEDHGRELEDIEDVLKTVKAEYDEKIRRICVENGLKFKYFKADKVKNLETF